MPKSGKGELQNNKQLKLKKRQVRNIKSLSDSPESLLTDATALLVTAQPDLAFKKAQKALNLIQADSEPCVRKLPALCLLGEISVQLGDFQSAQSYFLEAISLDPDGKIFDNSGDGSSKFFWLAQLNDEGGASSIRWFEKGCDILRREISEAKKLKKAKENEKSMEILGTKLANALCSMVEVYMTDLSWEDDAESHCETYIAEALLVAPKASEPLQTLASIRISQERTNEARSALRKSIGLWEGLLPQDSKVPDISSRISLSRLLMEAEMESDAFKVIERLIEENDSSVEAWYLGGWCLYLMSKKSCSNDGMEAFCSDAHYGSKENQWYTSMSRKWLKCCLGLYQEQNYDDERMESHVNELLAELKSLSGLANEDSVSTNSEWEDEHAMIDDMDEE